MPRPTSKQELLDQSTANCEKLLSFIDSLDSTDRSREFGTSTMNRSIRDVLGHIHHWHTMFLKWYNVGSTGVKPEMPAPGYTWRSVPDLNRVIHKTYSNTDLQTMIELFRDSHESVMEIIENHTDAELFEKKRFKWTGSTSLGAYSISATSSHYAWGLKLIKKGLI